MSDSLTHFEEIFRKYRPGLVAFAVTIIHNSNEAEEVVHDVFISYWNGGEYRNIQNDAALKSYLFRAVKNRSLNQLRKAKVDYTDLPADESVISVSPSVIEELSTKEIKQKVHALIEQLPKKCRQIFIMSRTYEMSHKEIAEILNISTKTVENQIGIALKFLRVHIPRD